MAISVGKIAILAGAGILGSVLAKEGRLSSVSDFISGITKITLKQIKQDDSTSSVKKQNDNILLNQVNDLRQELQMLASNRSIAIVTASGTGLGLPFSCIEHLQCASRYVTVLVIAVVGYGYIWWKGWKLPDITFATRRGLSDACTSIAQQLENVYSAIRATRRQLSSSIDRVDSNLNDVTELTANTHERVTELLQHSENIGQDVRLVRSAVETLELKISRIEGKQDLTNLGVKKLCDYAYSMENNTLRENIQSLQASSQLQSSSRIGALPPPSCEPSTPASNRSFQISNGITGAVEVTPNPGTSNGLHSSDKAINGSAVLLRTRRATTTVLHRIGSRRLQA